MERERKSLDAFSILVVALAAVGILIVVLAVAVPDLALRMVAGDPTELQSTADERIRPLGQYYLPGEEHQAPEPVVEHAEPAAPVEAMLTGPQVYNEACIACHGSGIGGAPILGDVAAWAPRIAQGIDVLREHAIAGFEGSTGYMPPKGARIDLADQEVNNAVDYMVDSARE